MQYTRDEFTGRLGILLGLLRDQEVDLPQPMAKDIESLLTQAINKLETE